MSSFSNGPARPDEPGSSRPRDAEGPPLTRRQKFWLIVKVVEVRLRFVVLMAATGFVFASWDDLWNRYEKWMRPAGDWHLTGAVIEFFCPMHPHVVQEGPGRCPICGMTLAKRKKGEKGALPEGVLARVQLAPARVEQAGIRTAVVAYTSLSQSVTTVGYVAYDERRLATVASKVPGKTRVEKLYANYNGKDVEAGEPLAELYSPELDQAFQELLSTARRADQGAGRLRTAEARALLGDPRDLVNLASEKLRRWGIAQAQIDAVLRRHQAGPTIALLSPIAGHVIRKNVFEGQEVPESFAMFEVADLRTVWVQAQVYEHQLGLIREGQAVRATVEALPGRSFAGRVEKVQPHLDPATRTVEVRYSLENPDRQLRPGMYATVTLETPVAETPLFRGRLAAARPSGGRAGLLNLTVAEQQVCPVTKARLGSMGEPLPAEVEGGKVWTCCKACPPKLRAAPTRYLGRSAPPPRDEVLSVPESAVIDTGRHQVVYVEAEPGVFEGRHVALGPRIGDRFPVLDGLEPGEKVAAAGAFLIDAESRLNPASTSTPAEPGTAEARPKAVAAAETTRSEPPGVSAANHRGH
jgi:Cu(I)/Ag(I) efflux system membrane fusion protein